MRDITVSVLMLAYNQKDYIAEAIEHVLKQKAAFAFELIIGEDCSTDGTREIVFGYAREYPDIVRVVTSETNVGPAVNKNRILEASLGKYVAICDGDDYWHDPGKLRKQVDFLDAHPDYGLVHTDFDRLDSPSGRRFPGWQQSHETKIPTGDVYEELLTETFISTSTVCFRREFVDRWLKDEALSDKRFIQRDYETWLFIARHAKAGYLSLSTTTKRHLHESMSRSQDQKRKYEYYLSLYGIQKLFMDRFPCSDETRERILTNFHIQNLRLSSGIGDFRASKKSYLYLRPRCFFSLRNAYYLFMSFVRSLL